MEILGVDIGGTGIKCAPVDVEKGILTAPRSRIPTPNPSKPGAVAEAVAELVKHYNWSGPVGVGFPSPIKGGVCMTAANVHKKWIGTNANELFADATHCPVITMNDADVAGLAEMTFGAGRDRKGVVLIVTIGTGLGTALFTDGRLQPNLELGHIEIDGKDAESRASEAARQRSKLSWQRWGKRFNIFLDRLEKLVWPDLIILGGGGSRNFDRFKAEIKVQAKVTPAQFLNDAGVVGAALAAIPLMADK